MPRPWIVTPHDPILPLEDNLWVVEGQIPGVPHGRRRMTLARRHDGDLVFFNAIPLDEPALAQVRAWGRPAYLVISTASHCIDAHAFRAHLGLQLVCAAAAVAKVQRTAPIDLLADAFPPDPLARLVPLPGTRSGELVLVATAPCGHTSLAFGDAFMNLSRDAGLLMRLLGFSGGPKCPPVFRAVFVRDKPAFAAALATLAALPQLARLIPSHGAILTQDPAPTLLHLLARDLRYTQPS